MITTIDLYSAPEGVVDAGEPEGYGPEPSDLRLARSAGDGDTSALGELYRRYNRRVYTLCLRMTANTAEAEDLAQEVFIKLYSEAGSFRGESAFTTWLHRLTVNVVLIAQETARPSARAATRKVDGKGRTTPPGAERRR